MGARSSGATEASEREVTITRILDAPRSLVFRAWTSPEHLKRWWGPHGFTVLSCEMDFRVGGAWRLAMRSPQGVVDRQRGEFREIIEPERIVFSYAFDDENGKPGHQTIVSVDFAEVEGETKKTRLTVHQAVFESVTVRNDHIGGWGEALDHLVDYLAQV
jgi:uncharacterized protein YndB with AHSA1/START domain